MELARTDTVIVPLAEEAPEIGKDKGEGAQLTPGGSEAATHDTVAVPLKPSGVTVMVEGDDPPAVTVVGLAVTLMDALITVIVTLALTGDEA